jgi:HSP20 family molecular chaperone IbpA
MMTMMLPAYPFGRPARHNGRRLLFDSMQDDVDSFSSVFPSSAMSVIPRSRFHLLGDVFDEAIDDMFAPAFALERQAQCFANRFGCFDKKMKGSFDIETGTNDNGDMTITAPMPGMNQNDVSIDVKDGVLTISVNKTEKKTIQSPPTELRLESQSAPAAIQSETQVKADDNADADANATGTSMLDQLRASASESTSIFEKDQQEATDKTEEEPSAQQPTNACCTTDDNGIAADSSWGYQTSSFHAQRRVRLPKDHIEANITASMEDGVLHIVVPRERPASARKINIASRL